VSAGVASDGRTMSPSNRNVGVSVPPGLARLNAMERAEAERVLHAVCGSRAWVEAIAERRPFADAAGLYAAADAAWFALDEQEMLEAFSHHPRIGERKLDQPRFAATAAQSSREQSGMAGAPDEVRAAFVAGNAAYERKFGHVFLICATGKSGEEMLAALRARLGNDAATELRNAAAEQAKIIGIRLERLVSE
jgi:OHCU decarboxylase